MSIIADAFRACPDVTQSSSSGKVVIRFMSQLLMEKPHLIRIIEDHFDTHRWGSLRDAIGIESRGEDVLEHRREAMVSQIASTGRRTRFQRGLTRANSQQTKYTLKEIFEVCKPAEEVSFEDVVL